MKPIFQSRFSIFWDGIFIIASAFLLIEIPAYIYAPTDQMFSEYQLFLLPFILIGIMIFYSLTLRYIVIYPTMVLFKKPLGFSNRYLYIQQKDITQVELEQYQYPKLTVYHHAEGTSIILYEDEILPIKKAFAQIDIIVE